MTTAEKEKYRNWGIGLAIVLFVVFLWPHNSTWSGEGEVSLFVTSNSAKNYRVPAEMEVTSKSNGWMKSNYKYDVSSVTWPNGGHSNFSGCIINNDIKTYCSDDDGNDYYVQVSSAPDAPDPEPSSSDY